MATEPQLTKKDLSVPDMGITFNEIHSDEPHEAVDGKKTEVKEPYIPGLGTNIGNRENVFDVGKAYEDEHNEVGMIVSDKKQSRGFIEGISGAFREWWGGTKKTLNTPIIAVNNPPKLQAVQKAETRAEVIKSAISPNTLAPKDDHHVIIEKIRTFKQDVARATGASLVTKDTEEKKTGWTHTTEDIPASISKIETPPQNIPPSDLRATSSIAPIVEQRSEVKIGKILEERPVVPSTPPRAHSEEIDARLAKITVPETIEKKETIVVPPRPLNTAPQVTNGSIPVEKIERPKQEEVTHTPATARPKISSFFQKKQKTLRDDSHVSISAIPMTMPTQAPERARIPVVLPKPPQQKMSAPSIEKSSSITPVAPAPTITKAPKETTVESPNIQKEIPNVPVAQPIPRIPLPQQTIEVTPVSQKIKEEKPQPQIPPTPKPPVREPVEQRSEAVELPKLSPHETPIASAGTGQASQFHTPEKKVTSIPKRDEAPRKVTENKISPDEKKQNSSSIASLTRWVLLGVVALIGVALAIFASVYMTKETVTENHVEEVRETIALVIPKLFAVDAQVPIQLGDDRDTFLRTLREKVTTATEDTVHFYPIQQSGEASYPAATTEILSVLGISLNAKTQRVLEDSMMFGSVKTTQNEPFIIIQSYNFDALFSGMLGWEKNLYTDLSPLFGSATTTSSPFTDKIVRNKSVRIMHTNDGTNEIILYSFINQNTVVITSSTEALVKIIDTFVAKK